MKERTLLDRGLALNPNLAFAWHFSALTKAWLGQPEIAIEHAARAIRLSPQDPQMFAMQDRHRLLSLCVRSLRQGILSGGDCNARAAEFLFWTVRRGSQWRVCR